MLNAELLDKKIIESGIKVTVIAKALEMSLPTFRSKRRGNVDFTTGEAYKLIKILHLTRAEVFAIFFAKECELNSATSA